MNEEKLRRFINDIGMSNAVYNVLLESFLKESKEKDVNTLAASRIAIDLLRQGWKDLDKFKQIKEVDSREGENIGL